MTDLREQFGASVDRVLTGKFVPEVLVVAIKMPPYGAIETITNHGYEQIRSKLAYYLNNYDDDFCLRHNPEIRIINYMLI